MLSKQFNYNFFYIKKNVNRDEGKIHGADLESNRWHFEVRSVDLKYKRVKGICFLKYFFKTGHNLQDHFFMLKLNINGLEILSSISFNTQNSVIFH